MNNVENSLNSLLPQFNHVLPGELLNLSTALLAQSRVRAATLKPDEEIARPYACAEIACKRLRSKLRLPTLQSRPPVPPRVYKKLSTYLEQALPARIPKRPNSVTAEQDDVSPRNTPKKQRLAGSVTSTPSKSALKASSTASTPITIPRKKVLFKGEIAERASRKADDGQAPAHIMPLIRRLCAAFSTSLCAPHVFTGFSVVFPLTNIGSGKQKKAKHAATEEELKSRTSTLVIALYFMVLAKMQTGELDAETYERRTKRAVEAAELGLAPGSINGEAINDWLMQIKSSDWAEGMEWWDNVPEDVIEEGGVNLESALEPAEDIEDDEDTLAGTRAKMVFEDDGEEDDDGDVLLPGLGTMMQERVDWLSEDRQVDYLDWKREIMARIMQMERSGS